MSHEQENGRWRPCAGCGRERRLAHGGAVMCDHNRWDEATRTMVPCEGSGQHPQQDDGALDAGGASAQGAAGPVAPVEAGAG
jgi:hypothetical protein